MTKETRRGNHHDSKGPWLEMTEGKAKAMVRPWDSNWFSDCRNNNLQDSKDMLWLTWGVNSLGNNWGISYK